MLEIFFNNHNTIIDFKIEFIFYNWPSLQWGSTRYFFNFVRMHTSVYVCIVCRSSWCIYMQGPYLLNKRHARIVCNWSLILAAFYDHMEQRTLVVTMTDSTFHFNERAPFIAHCLCTDTLRASVNRYEASDALSTQHWIKIQFSPVHRNNLLKLSCHLLSL